MIIFKGKYLMNMTELRNASIMLLFLAGIECFIFASWSAADIYRYTDKSGTECYTDDLDSIPLKYRKKAVLISRQPEEKEPRSGILNMAAPMTAPEAPEEAQKRGWSDFAKEKIIANKDFGKNPVFKIIAGLAGIVVGFIAIGKASRALGMRQIGNVLRIALALFVLAYLFSSYMKVTVSSFLEMKKDAEEIKERAEQRNQKIENAADEMFDRPGGN
ncbi:MAG: DUF4124 domain-containing protein [Thermodesulfovibrionales bacterium]|nr:DUF4124 domain-containing protein [Thermodesulfovibrionales bacterium]